MLNAADLNNIRTCASDIRTHRVQKVCKVNDMRLLSGIFDNRQALCLNGGEHEIDSCTDGNHIEIDKTAGKVRSLNINHCILLESYC